MDVGFDAHLQVGDLSFDADDAALLRAVDEEGSLHAAASALGRSYSRAHRRVTALEAVTGPLVERQRGGSGGGGSELTGTARDLLTRFARVQAALSGTAAVDELVLDGRVTSRDGELATVETAAGPVRALCLEDADRVQVTVRADAITLHDTDAAPPTEGTSARNRFEGRVETVEPDEAIARVTVDIGATRPATVLVTRESLQTLGIEPGATVVVSFKATATRATGVS